MANSKKGKKGSKKAKKAAVRGQLIKGKHEVKLFSGKGKLKGRTCVMVKLKKAPKSAVKGVKLAPVQFHGCFKSKAAAVKRAHVLAKKTNLKGEPKR